MRKSMLTGFAVLAAVQAMADGLGVRPGLWETHVLKHVVDGRDTTAQIAGAAVKMQQMMAGMPAEQRAQMESMMKDHFPPGAAPGSIRMCITPEQAKQGNPFAGREGCEKATVNRSGNRSTFEFSCTRSGSTTSGKGEATIGSDSVSSVVDTTIKQANGESHVMHSESEMKFISADCGDVKPITPPKDAP